MRRKREDGKLCKDKKGKIIVDRRGEMTQCPEVRYLNRSAAGLLDLAPSKKILRGRNNTMMCYLVSTLGMMFTQNSSSNNRASFLRDIGCEPINQVQKQHDLNRVFKDNEYLAANPKLAHYMDVKGNFAYNRDAVGTVVMNVCKKHAQHLLETEMLESGKQLATMNPNRYYRWAFSDLFKKIDKHGFTSDWTEVKGNGKGGLALDGVVFFNEALIYMPALVQFAIYLPEAVRESFLNTVNRGEATQKIWQIVDRIGLKKFGYPMKYDEKKKQGVFVVEPWMKDKDLDKHNKQNEIIRTRYVDCFKNLYKERERSKTENDIDHVFSEGEEAFSGDNAREHVAETNKGKVVANGGQDALSEEASDVGNAVAGSADEEIGSKGEASKEGEIDSNMTPENEGATQDNKVDGSDTGSGEANSSLVGVLHEDLHDIETGNTAC